MWPLELLDQTVSVFHMNELRGRVENYQRAVQKLFSALDLFKIHLLYV